MVKHSGRRPRLRVTGGGRGLGSHVGARLLADLADAVGLGEAMSEAMAPTRRRRGGRDRGEALVDAAVMIADGGDTISDIAVLADQPLLFGEVASRPTLWRALGAVDDAALERVRAARAQARAKAWAAGADPGFYVIDIDATLIGSHSDKQGAAGDYKGGWGFHPLLAYLDATGEALAGLLRPGNAGSNTAADHVTVLDDALAQLPVDPRRVEVVVRTDSAGWSHGFVEACRDRGVRFVIGHSLDIDTAKAVVGVPERCWQPTVSADGSELREHAEVTETTEQADLSRWPDRCPMIARREDPHPGAQLTFTDAGGHRFQVFVTDLADTDIAYLEALHRGRGRAERRICDNKATGPTKLPSHSFAINTAWLQLAPTAHDLLTWTRHLALAGDLAQAEPKRLRYCLLHTAAHIVTTGRQRYAKLSDDWPWTPQLIAAFERVHNLPLLI